MIHYIYKIIFLRGYPCGRYYIGKRSYGGKNLIKDSYCGSGNFCKAYFKKYGAILGDTYLKEIVEINPSKKINETREKIIIGNLWETDPLCMNMCPGGQCGGILLNVKQIDQYTLDGKLVKTWANADEIANTLNINKSSILDICKYPNGNRHTAGGYRWTYHGNALKELNYKKDFHGFRKVHQFDKNGNLVATYNSLRAAADAVDAKWQTIQRCCIGRRATTHGYLWAFEGNRPTDKAFAIANRNCTKIQQLTITGDVVGCYSTIQEAAEKTGFSTGSIQNASHDGKLSCGFLWKRIPLN